MTPITARCWALLKELIRLQHIIAETCPKLAQGSLAAGDAFRARDLWTKYSTIRSIPDALQEPASLADHANKAAYLLSSVFVASPRFLTKTKAAATNATTPMMPARAPGASANGMLCGACSKLSLWAPAK